MSDITLQFTVSHEDHFDALARERQKLKEMWGDDYEQNLGIVRAFTREYRQALFCAAKSPFIWQTSNGVEHLLKTANGMEHLRKFALGVARVAEEDRLANPPFMTRFKRIFERVA